MVHGSIVVLVKSAMAKQMPSLFLLIFELTSAEFRKATNIASHGLQSHIHTQEKQSTDTD